MLLYHEIVTRYVYFIFVCYLLLISYYFKSDTFDKRIDFILNFLFVFLLLLLFISQVMIDDVASVVDDYIICGGYTMLLNDNWKEVKDHVVLYFLLVSRIDPNIL